MFNAPPPPLNLILYKVNQQTLLRAKEFVAPATNKRVLNMNNVSSVASNIMNKYGWKEGQGNHTSQYISLQRHKKCGTFHEHKSTSALARVL